MTRRGVTIARHNPLPHGDPEQPDPQTAHLGATHLHPSPQTPVKIDTLLQNQSAV